MIELLAPAGNLIKLQTAFEYGADAVYLGGDMFSLRALSGEFEGDRLERAIDYAHSIGKKVYVTANIIPHNNDIPELEEYITFVKEAGADAIIVADPGVVDLCLKCGVGGGASGTQIHLSTQANNINYASCNFWHGMGVKRVILGRELSLDEIREIRERVPDTLELEVFVHGAMCIGYSGRCLISNYVTSRDSNRGKCAQPCRWEYNVSAANSTDSDEFDLDLTENERGTFIFNSKDLCLINYIKELAEAGVSSFKIEGRMKSEYYLATVVKAYRGEIDRYLQEGAKYNPSSGARAELEKVSHRVYSEGFINGRQNDMQIYGTSSYIRSCDFVGVVEGCDGGFIKATQRGKFLRGDTLEILQPRGENVVINNCEIYDEDGAEIDATPHPMMTFKVKYDGAVEKGSFIRKI
ncbi:MAG: U32 family peptidase [Clostridiales bacterium]|nr:U32 family peptidase [Clostridiales bacterium]